MASTMQVEVRQVGATTSEARARGHEVLIDRPEEKGGSDRGPLGGELLLFSLGGCFMSTLLAAIRTRDSAVSDVQVMVEATLAEAPDRFSALELTVRAEHEDPDEMRRLITIAERGCLVTNTLKQGMPVTARLVE